jgi:amino acid adenylation domain-containing protein
MNYLLTDSIEQSAKKLPYKDAFVCLNQSVTYTDLNRQMNQLASLLVSRGIQKGDRVGIYMNRCLETATAVYGIMKAGAAYVPLDPTAPPARTRFLIEDCEITHVITQPSQRRALKAVIDEKSCLTTIIGLSQDWPVETISWETVFGQQVIDLDLGVTEMDLAYIIYTSGSTGVPKGIMHTHRSGMAYARLSADLYDLTEEDRVGNHCALHFDISTFGYFTAPLVAATTVIVTDAHTKMPASQAQLIASEKITVWYSVPLALIQMLESGAFEGKSLPDLRWVLFGGESFPANQLRTLMEWWPGCSFSNVYGPAEVNQCTYYNLTTPPENDEPVPLGKIWKNTQGLIVDDADREVKQGEIGELVIRSATMMYGYWKQPELTARSLLKRTTASGIEEIYYRTGDLAKENDEGNLMFFGRKDRQIKVRGYRVELEEVADVILKNPSVSEAAVVAVPKTDGTLKIVAQIALKAGKELNVDELNADTRQHLPKYAQPEMFNLMDRLPRTGAGKIDYNELREIAKELNE